ncbi:phosphate ABC transporter substrate-binding protein PstS [Arcanobacterium bovis]|uniref:Phosphate-binding protein n=1 Tax=Arcanobacterium bovis TaxID=2529275 RepID=A0A4Q9V131_9ACTO|nr:phosphate ABC transporter substrate-binding protein PstS [Arcanobacterium bovis]TBW21457.1 phosphate ABC transporter substrate-binding protein PstS [Arcanobacterium bovis]
MNIKRGYAAVASLAVITLGLTACSSADSKNEDTKSSSSKSTGTLNGSGASSQVNAQQAWRDNFTKDSGVVVNYDPTGSGTGRDQFISGKVAFAGSDSMLKAEEVKKATERCSGQEPLELPLYISPIAVAFNLEGVKSLNLTADVIAKIFDGKITKWNDPAIADLNKDAKLPDLAIIPVNRADKSGTTENFQQYLAAAAPSSWTYKPADVWPRTGTQSAEKTSGVVNLVKSTQGAVTYADASQVGELGTAAVEVSGEFLKYSPEAAAKIVDGSAPTKDASERRLTVDLKRDGSIKGAYPIVMVSYLIACTQYADAKDAANVKAYFTYVASKEGQEAASKAKGGNAPISDTLRGKVETALKQIKG